LHRIGKPSSFACPECHGVLLELSEGDRVRFRCQTGHAYSTESLLAAINEKIEESMWTAIRALEEGGMLMNAVAEHLKSSHSPDESARFRVRADEARGQSEVVRKLL